MKGIYFVGLFLVLGCSRIANDTSSDKMTTNIDWLVGDWICTNGQKGENTFESWTKTDEGYAGSAVSLVKGDTVFQESIKAYLDEGQWHYEVSGPHEKPIIFTFTSLTDSSFICENPANDFPNTINYAIEGDSILAAISNDGEKEILFRYGRKL